MSLPGRRYVVVVVTSSLQLRHTVAMPPLSSDTLRQPLVLTLSSLFLLRHSVVATASYSRHAAMSLGDLGKRVRWQSDIVTGICSAPPSRRQFTARQFTNSRNGWCVILVTERHHVLCRLLEENGNLDSQSYSTSREILFEEVDFLFKPNETVAVTDTRDDIKGYIPICHKSYKSLQE